MNINNPIAKFSISSPSNNNETEARIKKLEQVFSVIISMLEKNNQTGQRNHDNNQSNIIQMLVNNLNASDLNKQMPVYKKNYDNSLRSSNKNISLSQSQIIAELASAILKSNQRSS